MKAIILAGGQGTRLRSITGGQIPKPMVSIAGRPVLEYLLVTLRRNGITDICCTLRTLPEAITGYFGSGEDVGVNLHYRIESTPLGTAGAVAACRDFTGDESFIVCCGDALLDCELQPLTELHEKSGAAATLGLYRSSLPLSFGLCVTDRDHRVCAFVEKPDWAQVVTDQINAGIYVFSPEVFAHIPKNQSYDIGGELLPALLRENKKVCALPLEGYWRDIGSELSYYQANLDVRSGKLPHFAPPREKKQSAPRRYYPCELHFPTVNAARLMAALSASLMEAGADFTDGLRSEGVHIAPQSGEELLVESADQQTLAHYAELCRTLEAENE